MLTRSAVVIKPIVFPYMRYKIGYLSEFFMVVDFAIVIGVLASVKTLYKIVLLQCKFII